MRVCYFGTYEQNYPRNMNMIKGLKDNGAVVKELNRSIWKNKTHKTNFSIFGKLKLMFSFISAYLYLFVKALFLKTDCFIVGYPGHLDIFVIKIICILRSKPLIFDPLLSLYDSMVFDRKILKENSLIAYLLFLIDKYACKSADMVVLDTNEHIEYFKKLFDLKKTKFLRVLVGCNDEVFFPRDAKKREKFTVCFHGKFIPLQGVEFIVQAAKILQNKDVHFIIVGSGQTYDGIREYSEKEKITNIEFHGFCPIEELPKYHYQSHVSLGIFGATDKAKRVIPNKFYEIIALRQPAITGASDAIKELFIDGKHCLMCEMGNSNAIAETILKLKEDIKLREKISEGGYRLYKESCTPATIGKTFYNDLKVLIKKKR